MTQHSTNLPSRIRSVSVPVLGALVVAGGGTAVGDERAARGEEAPGADDARAADVVEDGVHSPGGELADACGEIRGAVVDGLDTLIA